MILQSIVRGAKSFAAAFRHEYRAQLIARGHRALQEMQSNLDLLSPEEHAQLNKDTTEILRRAKEINAARRPKDKQ